MKILLRNCNTLVLLVLMLFLVSCAGMQSMSDMSPKQKLTMAYGTYNSQYSLYMADTGYVLNAEGVWEKTSAPTLSDDKRMVLKKKKDILTKMHPLIRLYDSMVNGTIPYSTETEASLFALIDEIALLVPD